MPAQHLSYRISEAAVELMFFAGDYTTRLLD